MKKLSLRIRLMIIFLSAVFVCIAATGLFSSSFFVKYYLNELTNKLEERAVVLEFSLRNIPENEYQETVRNIAGSLGEKVRITIINSDGAVLADSSSVPADMDNHITRPEVVEAIKSGAGSSMRMSDTVKKEFLYVARKMKSSDGSYYFIRVAAPTEYISETVRHIKITLLTAALSTALGAVFMSWLISSMFTAPVLKLKETAAKISGGDLTARSRISGADEFSDLSHSIDEMADNLQEYIESIHQKKSEVENILSSIRDGIVVVDLDGKIILNNEGLFNVFSLRKENVIGKSLLDVVRNKKIIDGVYRAIDSGEVFENEIVTNPITKTVISIKLFPFHGDAGEVTGAILTARDITEVKRLETVRTEFIENASHELRTPVALIKGFVETLQGKAKNDPEALSRFLTLLEKESTRLTNLTEDILALEKAERKHTEEDMESIDLVATVKEIADSYATIAANKSLNFKVDASGEPAPVKISIEELGLVVRNLIDNAVKYTEEGAVNVAAGVEGGRAFIRVIDTGVGIPPEEMKKIFQRFYRVDKSRARDSGGTGLGLSIVKNIAEKWGGTVSVDSTPGEGSTFSAYFTLA